MTKFTQQILGKLRTSYLRRFLIVGSLVLLSACGGNGTESGIFAVGGTISGLNPGAQVTLNNNGNDPLVISANGQFVFNKKIFLLDSYTITVDAQPTGQVCTVTNSTGSGIVANVTDVIVMCSATTFTIGGTVSGLKAGNTVVLKNNSADPLTLTANGAFTFATPVALGSSYTVTVGAQPTDQVCTVNHRKGSNVSMNITDVDVICSATGFTVSGQVMGLDLGHEITLVNNDADPITIKENGQFTFGTPIAQGGSYDVTIDTFPLTEFCMVKNGSGANVTANVTNVIIECGPFVKVTLYSFGSDNPTPNNLIQGQDGNFYGTTAGGSGVPNTFFQITPNGVQSTLHVFSFGRDGIDPARGIIQADNSNFYGTTIAGGGGDGGTVYQLTQDGFFTPFGSFNIPDTPGAVIQVGLTLVGTTEAGYAPNNKGVIYSIGPLGSITNQVILHTFVGSDGDTPRGALIMDSVGNLYGTTVLGGVADLGTIYKLSPQGQLTTLHSFSGGSNGSLPQTGIILGRDGNFYGTTQGTGDNNPATIFKLTPNNVLTTLFVFKNNDIPYSNLIEASDGKFYGTTFNGGINNVGSVFSITPQGQFSTLYSFGGDADGIARPSTLIQATDGVFYGISDIGGAGGVGTFFSLVPLSN